MATLENILGRAKKDIISADDLTSLDSIRVKYLGKKGELSALLKGIGETTSRMSGLLKAH